MYEKCDTFVSLINFKVISEKSVPFSNAWFFFSLNLEKKIIS